MAHLVDAPGPMGLMTPRINATPDTDFNVDETMDVDAQIVDDPYADIAAVNALVSPNEKQFELFVTKVSFCPWLHSFRLDRTHSIDYGVVHFWP